MKKVTLLIPCYNEEEVLPWAMGKLQTMIGKMKAETGIEGRLVLVDDGSRDRKGAFGGSCYNRPP